MNIDDIYNKLVEKIQHKHIIKDEPMGKHTSFKIGGPVDIMIVPNDVEEVQHAIRVCEKWGMPYDVIGNGSNLLVRDKGIRGVVIKIAENFSKVEFNDHRVKAQGGILLSALSKMITQKSLGGFEFASGIPGTLGGAIAMNAGAYGGEMKDIVLGASTIDHEGNIIYLSRDELKLGYRSSAVQNNGFVVLEVDMEFTKGNFDEIREKVKDLTQRRTTKQPLQFPSAGSTFKRPHGYFAAKLIEDAGLKGLRLGGAMVSDLHAGFIVNIDHASAEDVINLIKVVQKVVRDKFNVELEREVKVLGEE